MAPGCTEPVRTGWPLCGVSTDSSFVPLYTTSLGFPAREQFPITGNARSPKEKLRVSGVPFSSQKMLLGELARLVAGLWAGQPFHTFPETYETFK